MNEIKKAVELREKAGFIIGKRHVIDKINHILSVESGEKALESIKKLTKAEYN